MIRSAQDIYLICGESLFAVCLVFDCRNCDCAAMIRSFSAKVRRMPTFSNCGMIRSPDGAKRNPGAALQASPSFPDCAALHPGYNGHAPALALIILFQISRSPERRWIAVQARAEIGLPKSWLWASRP